MSHLPAKKNTNPNKTSATIIPLSEIAKGIPSKNNHNDIRFEKVEFLVTGRFYNVVQTKLNKLDINIG